MPQSDLQYLAQIANTAPSQLRLVLTHQQQQRAYYYRRLGLLAGTVCFLACIGVFTYLVVMNHERSALAILGATVLSVVTLILKQKL